MPKMNSSRNGTEPRPSTSGPQSSQRKRPFATQFPSHPKKRSRMAQLKDNAEIVEKDLFLTSLTEDSDIKEAGIDDNKISAAGEVGERTIDELKKILIQRCATCLHYVSRDKIQNLILCDCPICTDCFIEGFTYYIKELPVTQWSCPLCQKPQLKQGARDSEEVDFYFSFLDNQLQALVPLDIYELFTTKLRDWRLSHDQLYVWCANPTCENGFYPPLNRNEATCPHCSKSMCVPCKDLWTDDHKNRTCAEYQELKRTKEKMARSVNYTNVEKYRITSQEATIGCPNCKDIFSLAKGGCIHFVCPKCKHEFCSDCNQEFTHSSKGLQCIHPRNCLYYLRDWDSDQLKDLLDNHSVVCEIENTVVNGKGTCPVMEVKQNGSSMVDAECGQNLVNNSIGLCLKHHKEELVKLVNEHKLDPAEKMNVNQLKLVLQRHKITIPTKESEQTDSEYKNNLQKLIYDKLPLDIGTI